MIGSAATSLAEIVYTKDGEVIKGSIVREDGQNIYVKTRYTTRRIPRRFIRRIMYGDREMEPVYIIMKDGTTISGYLVDQDAGRVYMRKDRKNPKETVILKSEIRQMSQGKLVPPKPAVTLRAGVFMPLHSGGAELESSMIFLGDISFNPSLLERLRLYVEAGYTNLPGSDNDDEYFRIIPITAGISYTIPIYGIDITPRMGCGISVLEFNTGEESTYRGVDFTASASLGIGHEFIKNRLSLSLWGDYFLIIENKNYFKSAAVTAAVKYYL